MGPSTLAIMLPNGGYELSKRWSEAGHIADNLRSNRALEFIEAHIGLRKI